MVQVSIRGPNLTRHTVYVCLPSELAEAPTTATTMLCAMYFLLQTVLYCTLAVLHSVQYSAHFGPTLSGYPPKPG